MDFEKNELLKEKKNSQASLEKNAKDIKKLTEDLRSLDIEKNDNNNNYIKQKEQLSGKINKLTEECKLLEVELSSLKNQFRIKNIEINTIKDNCTRTNQNLLLSFSNLKEKILKIIDQKRNTIIHIQEFLINYIMKLKENLKNKAYQLERSQTNSKKETLLLNEVHLKEINSLKSSQKDFIDNLEDKFSQETQELQLYYEDIIKRSNIKNEKSQEDLKVFYLSQIDHINNAHLSQIEDLKSTQAKTINELKQGSSQQIKEQNEQFSSKLSLLDTELKNKVIKHQEEIANLNKDWEYRVEQARLSDEDAFTSMMKSKQKEIDQLI